MHFANCAALAADLCTT